MYNTIHYNTTKLFKFTTDFAGERFLIIGQHLGLMKLGTYERVTFYGPRAVVVFLLN